MPGRSILLSGASPSSNSTQALGVLVAAGASSPEIVYWRIAPTTAQATVQYQDSAGNWHNNVEPDGSTTTYARGVQRDPARQSGVAQFTALPGVNYRVSVGGASLTDLAVTEDPRDLT
jgi:hypothetical protein